MIRKTCLAIVALCALPAKGMAQVPPAISAELVKFGRVVSAAGTATLYRPLFGADWMARVRSTKDIGYGTDPRQLLDIYTPAQSGRHRPVLIFFAGGAGMKQMRGYEGEPFYGNVGAWGVRHGMTVIIAQYRFGGGAAWDAGAQDVGAVIRWAKTHIAEYGGDPRHIAAMGHSNGAAQLATYLGHPDLQADGRPGLDAAILIGGAFNMLPLRTRSIDRFSGVSGADAPPPPIVGAPPSPRAAPIDPQTLAKRSNLPGLRAVNVPLMLLAAELDPEEIVETVGILGEDLRQAGRRPTTRVVAGHSHISEILSFGTKDESVSGPVLRFLRKNW